MESHPPTLKQQPQSYQNRHKARSGSVLEKQRIHKQLINSSNAVSIDNMLNKKNLFMPFYPDLKNKKNQIGTSQKKFSYQFAKSQPKKQLEPHSQKIKGYNSIVNELIQPENKKSYTHIAKIKQSKHRKNISAVTKIMKQKIPQKNNLQQTKSFYLRQGERPVQYELKMCIMKYQNVLKQTQSQKKQRIDKKILIHPRAKFAQNQANSYNSKSLLLDQKLSNQSFINNSLKQQLQMKFIQNNNNEPVKNRYPKINKKILSRSVLKSTKNIKQKKQPQQMSINGYMNVVDLLKNDKNEQTTIQIINSTQVSEWIQKQWNLDDNHAILKNKSADCVNLSYFNRLTNQITPLLQKKSTKRVQIASITKIMTAFLIINIAKIFKLDIKQQKILISQKASKMPGTSALLAYSEILTVYQALHGLMLPSGNDAAVALGNWGGKVIRKYCSIIQRINRIRNKEPKSALIAPEFGIQQISYQKLFILHMNKAAKLLAINNTNFANTHGLMNQKAYSTARDVARLTAIAMKNPIFAQIVEKKQFQCSLFNRTFSQNRKTLWKNTNKLLKTNGFIGVKTGVTPSAGPCLSSMYKLNQNQFIIIIVLNVKSMEYRFKQSLALLKQYLQAHKNFISNLNSLDDRLPNSKKNIDIDPQENNQAANLTNSQQEQPSEDDEDFQDP